METCRKKQTQKRLYTVISQGLVIQVNSLTVKGLSLEVKPSLAKTHVIMNLIKRKKNNQKMKLILASRIENPITKYPNKEETW